jgi:predicted kinase
MRTEKPKLYLMLGYPGAGKTTTSRIIHELTGAVHLWADKIRNERYVNPTHSHEENLHLYDYLNELTAELLATGQDVIFDTNFNFYKDREYLRGIAARHGAETKLIWVQTPEETARERAVHPDHAQRNTYPQAMPAERFKRISKDLEPPKSEENAILVDGTKITPRHIDQLLRR